MNFYQIINSEKPVLVDFFAEWCGPCKMQGPILDELKKRVGDKVSILKVDVDKNQAVASKYHVRSVPTLIIFKKGEIVWKQSGVGQLNDLEKILKANY